MEDLNLPSTSKQKTSNENPPMLESHSIKKIASSKDDKVSLKDKNKKTTGKKKSDQRSNSKIRTDENSISWEWSFNEKKLLFEALKSFGPFDLANISKAVPSKSLDQIQILLKTLGRKARSSYKNIKQKRQFINTENSPHVISNAPIDQWLELLENSSLEKLKSINHRGLARTLFYISKYEDLPTPEESGGINFREIYEYLHCACMGLPYKSLNEPSAALILDCMKQMNEELQAFEFQPIEKHLATVSSLPYKINNNLRSTVLEDKYPDIAKFFSEPNNNPFGFPLEILIKDLEEKSSV